MIMIAALPPIPWHLLAHVLVISAAFAVGAVVLFSVGITSISRARNAAGSSVVRAAASTVALVVTLGIAYLAFLAFHFIITK